MKAFPSTAAWLALLLGPTASTAPEAPKPARFAVVALGQCSSTSSAITVRSFRALLQPKVGTALQSEADTAKPLGGLSERTLEEVERALAAARKDFYAHKTESAVGHLKELAADVTRIAPSEARWRAERDVLTLLAQAQLGGDAVAAEATLVSVLRVEPGYQPDSGLYPPSFRKWVDGIRAREVELPTNRLDVASSPSGKTVYVGGCPVGAAPLSHRFPAGEYRVEADFGNRSLAQTVVVPPPPAVVAPVQLAMGVEGSLFADGGPCLEPGTERQGSLARLAALVGTNRLLVLYKTTTEGHRWVVVEEADASGTLLREAQSQIQTGAPETEALGALAEWVAIGRSVPGVEVVKRANSSTSATAGAPGAQGQVSGTVTGQPAPKGFNVQAFPSSGQLAPSPPLHFPADKFKVDGQPPGDVAFRVVTDDGRVGTATTKVATATGSLVTVKVEPACTASARVVDGEGQPVASAHVVAQLLGSRISLTTQTGPKGKFAFKELTKGDYQLTVDLGLGHVARRFTVGSTCTTELGRLLLQDAPDANAPAAPRDAGPMGVR
jgi:hypothetical protein